MNISFTENAWEDYLYWQRMDKKIVKRVNEWIRDIKRNPFEGPGKPKPLKYLPGRRLFLRPKKRCPIYQRLHIFFILFNLH